MPELAGISSSEEGSMGGLDNYRRREETSDDDGPDMLLNGRGALRGDKGGRGAASGSSGQKRRRERCTNWSPDMDASLLEACLLVRERKKEEGIGGETFGGKIGPRTWKYVEQYLRSTIPYAKINESAASMRLSKLRSRHLLYEKLKRVRGVAIVKGLFHWGDGVEGERRRQDWMATAFPKLPDVERKQVDLVLSKPWTEAAKAREVFGALPVVTPELFQPPERERERDRERVRAAPSSALAHRSSSRAPSHRLSSVQFAFRDSDDDDDDYASDDAEELLPHRRDTPLHHTSSALPPASAAPTPPAAVGIEDVRSVVKQIDSLVTKKESPVTRAAKIIYDDFAHLSKEESFRVLRTVCANADSAALFVTMNKDHREMTVQEALK